MADLSPEQLMAEVQRGNMSAYQELIRQFQKRVFRVISGYHRDPEDAMEVLQDTFLKVYTARQTWENRTSLSAWLYRIAINASIDRYRRAGKTKAVSLEDVLESQLRETPMMKPFPDALDKMRGDELRHMLEEAIRRLPERQREVVSLRYFADMQLTEIAQSLKCPLGTVKSNLHKAVNSLKSSLMHRKEELAYE